MRAHWLSTFALVGVAAFVAGAFFWQALASIPPRWLVAGGAVAAAAVVLVRGVAERRR